ncbi:MAG: MFS transporter [Planctomyces sp.]|nr:MFS transporter [Planctomyces sp.]
MNGSPDPAARSWSRDPSFWGMTATQFLGAFNDNVFKQLILLLCIDLAQGDPARDRQGLAQALFAAPFILFSGFAGYLSDRNSKRTIVVLSKLAELGIMIAGLLAFLSGGLPAPMAVLFLMGAQSAFFGPPKYGILPELFAEHDLPKVNGVILMTTFLAIILAFPAAGALKMWFEGRLWQACFGCLVIAVAGILTSLTIRRTPIAEPGLPFRFASLVIHPGTWSAMKAQPGLLIALAASSLFWFTGGVVYPLVINSVGKLQLGLDDYRTGWLASCTGLGITIGCIAAGALCGNRFRAELVKAGMWGMLVSLLLLAIPGPGLVERDIPAFEAERLLKSTSADAPGAAIPPEMVRVAFRPLWLGDIGTRLMLVALGVCAGLFSVPVQVYLQARAPEDQKGRIIGVMNLFNWIAIALASQFYTAANVVLGDAQAPNLLFGAAALALLPLLAFYRPRSEALR